MSSYIILSKIKTHYLISHLEQQMESYNLWETNIAQLEAMQELETFLWKTAATEREYPVSRLTVVKWEVYIASVYPPLFCVPSEKCF